MVIFEYLQSSNVVLNLIFYQYITQLATWRLPAHQSHFAGKCASYKFMLLLDRIARTTYVHVDAVYCY